MPRGTGKRTACSTWMLCLISDGSCNKANIPGLVVGLCGGADHEYIGPFLLPWLIPATWQLLSLPLSSNTLSLFSLQVVRQPHAYFFLTLMRWISRPFHPNTFCHLQLHPCLCCGFCRISIPSWASCLLALAFAHTLLALPRDNCRYIFTRV